MNKTIQLHITKPGLQTNIVDGGRKGFEAFGIPKGGALDNQSYRLANWLVGNDLKQPVLEITLMGPQIEFSAATQIALTGADLFPKINNLKVAMNVTINIEKGSVLSFGGIQNGCRTYLAVRGIWQVEENLGSCSPMRFDERLKKGNFITIQKQESILRKKIALDLSPSPTQISIIRVILGPEFSHFSKKNIAAFFSKTYKISNNSNRMGYQLDTKLSDYQQDTELISSGIIPGTIQITPAGQPIILMRDAQTTGGYPRIVNVISADLDKLAQLKPSDELRFELVNVEEAQNLLAEKNKKIKQLTNDF